MSLLLCPANISRQAVHVLEPALQANNSPRAYLAGAFAVKQSQRPRSLAVINHRGTGCCPASIIHRAIGYRKLMLMLRVIATCTLGWRVVENQFSLIGGI